MPRKKNVNVIKYEHPMQGGVKVCVEIPEHLLSDGTVRYEALHNSFSITYGRDIESVSAANKASSVMPSRSEPVQPKRRGSAFVPPSSTKSAAYVEDPEDAEAADAILMHADVIAAQNRNASLDEIEKIIEGIQNTGAGPKPRSTRGQEIARASAALRTVSVETSDGKLIKEEIQN